MCQVHSTWQVFNMKCLEGIIMSKHRGEFDLKFNCDYSDCVSRDYHIPFLMLGTSNFCFCHADSVLLAKVHLMLCLNDNT